MAKNRIGIGSDLVLKNGNIGFGTTNPTSKIFVEGDGYFTGVVTAFKFYGDGSGLTNIGLGIVNTGEKNIIYVSKDGNDSDVGSLNQPKLTIKSAVSIATSNTVIRVAPGTYHEDNPIVVPDDITIIGYSLRETTIVPLNSNKDLFHIGSGNYIAEMSFSGALPGKSIVAFDPVNKRFITQSPYIQNCTNFIPNSIGMKVDGNDTFGPLKSMVLDSYTQYNQGGIGISITNAGYAQLVSLFTICDDVAVYCGSGGACDLTNSNSSFGNYGIIADGVSAKKYTGIVTVSTSTQSDSFVVNLSAPTLSISNASYDNISGILTATTTTNHNFNVGMGITLSGLGFTCAFENGTRIYPSGRYGYIFNVESTPSSNTFSAYVGTSTLPHTYQSGGQVKINVVRPFDGQVIYFNELFYTVKRLIVVNEGSGYTQTPTITIEDPSISWGVKSQAAAIVEDGKVVGADMISNGIGYKTVPLVTVSPPQSGINTAVIIAELAPEYYTIQKATPITNDLTIITLNDKIPFDVGIGTEVNFFKQSRILANGHSFEYIGSGIDIASCIPFNGGNPPIPENETDSRNGGLVIYTSTNQAGNFQIGDGVVVSQTTSTISGAFYSKSLVSNVIPYILSLGGF